jgi:predicted transposase YdaD
LARLRNLTQETQKQVTDMGLLYDITKDYLYQEGLNKGIEEGREVEKREFIISMLEEKAFCIEKIARLAKVSTDYVEVIAKELKK